MSSKSEILAGWKFKEERVTLPGGASALMREFSGALRDSYEQGMVKTIDGKREADLSNMRAKLVAPCLIDEETGEPMFTFEELSAAPASFLEPLWQIAQRLNGMGGESVGDAAKNSEAAPSGSSTSVSPAT